MEEFWNKNREIAWIDNELGKLLKRVIHLEEEKRPTATELMDELNKIRFY